MTEAFFSDLDNTLLFSAKHLRLTDPPVISLEVYNGEANGYMTQRAHADLLTLAAEIPFIPTTARHNPQYERLAFEGIRAEYIILSSGGMIIHNGERDLTWDKHVREDLLMPHFDYLACQAMITAKLENAGITHRLREVDDDLFFYYVFEKATDLLPDILADIRQLGEQTGFTVSLQNRKLYFVPSGLNKGVAVAEVANRLKLDRFYAAGDALLDASMIDIAHHGWIPRGSEIEPTHGQRPNVTVTQTVGVLASEQIVTEVRALTLRR